MILLKSKIKLKIKKKDSSLIEWRLPDLHVAFEYSETKNAFKEGFLRNYRSLIQTLIKKCSKK